MDVQGTTTATAAGREPRTWLRRLVRSVGRVWWARIDPDGEPVRVGTAAGLPALTWRSGDGAAELRVQVGEGRAVARFGAREATLLESWPDRRLRRRVRRLLTA